MLQQQGLQQRLQLAREQAARGSAYRHVEAGDAAAPRRQRMQGVHAAGETQVQVQAGAGIGLLMMALHGLTDYNWHIPANAIYYALMAGVFFHRGEPAPENKPVTREAVVETAPPPLPVVRENIKNPFAE